MNMAFFKWYTMFNIYFFSQNWLNVKEKDLLMGSVYFKKFTVFLHFTQSYFSPYPINNTKFCTTLISLKKTLLFFLIWALIHTFVITIWIYITGTQMFDNLSCIFYSLVYFSTLNGKYKINAYSEESWWSFIHFSYRIRKYILSHTFA